MGGGHISIDFSQKLLLNMQICDILVAVVSVKANILTGGQPELFELKGRYCEYDWPKAGVVSQSVNWMIHDSSTLFSQLSDKGCSYISI